MYLFSSLWSSLKVGFVGLLCEEVRQYPLLCDKQMKEYKEKDVVSNAWNAGAIDLEFIKICESNWILFFILCLGETIVRKRCSGLCQECGWHSTKCFSIYILD